MEVLRSNLTSEMGFLMRTRVPFPITTTRPCRPTYTSKSSAFSFLLLSSSFFAATPIQRGRDCVPASDPPNPPPGALPFSPASRPLAPGPSSPLSLRHFLPPLTPLAIHSTDSAATNAVGAYGSRAKTVPRCHVGGVGPQTSGDPVEGYHGPSLS